MEPITMYPKNEKQKSLLKSLLKEMKVRFVAGKSKDSASMTEDEFYAKIDKSIAQAEQGQARIISKEEQKKYLGF